MRNIAKQIIASLLLTIVIILGGWSAVEIRILQQTEKLKMANEASHAAERLAHNLVYPLWNLNREEVEKSIQFETMTSMISGIIVTEESGNIYTGKVTLPDGSITNWNQNNPAHRRLLESSSNKISKDIVHNAKTIGKVVLYTNDLYLKDLLRRQITFIIIKLTVLVCILFGVSYSLLRHLVVNPLIRLKEWALTVTAETRTAAPETGQTVEFTSLTTAINKMNQQLTESYDSLHEQAVLLETEMAEKQLANEELQLKTTELEEEIEERQAIQKNLEEQTTDLEEEIAERTRIQEVHDRLEEQLLQSQKMEAIGLLAGGVAHDFNNILSVVMGYGELLAHGLPDGRMRDNAIQVLNASERAAGLTKGLLAFSRKQTFNLENIDINQLATDSCKFLKRVIGEDIEFITLFQPTPLYLQLDRAQMQQVLMNLATNARDAMPSGGKLMISISTDKIDDAFVTSHGFGIPGKFVVIQVRDTGAGMDKETVLRIFEPFFTTKEKGKGTGLGLSIIHGIIAQHNGFIRCSSEPGQGTMFSIYLPMHEASGQITATEKEIDRQTLRGSETILLADDDRMLLAITAQHLEANGYRVFQALDGAEAVEIFTRHQNEIDLVILDAIMPKMTGKQAWDKISELRPGVKACFLSGYTSDIISGKIAVDYNVPFIAKPVMPGVLLQKVRQILEGA